MENFKNANTTISFAPDLPLFYLKPAAMFLLFPSKILEQNRALGNQCAINRY